MAKNLPDGFEIDYKILELSIRMLGKNLRDWKKK